MTSKKIILQLFVFLSSAFFAKAQVVLMPLQTNPVIEKYIKENGENLKSTLANDTISLPFFDDFAKEAVYPDNSNWLDSEVFINQTFGNNPPSIGVATFDALNLAGELHSDASSDGFISDTLTSKPINLVNYTEKNPLLISSALLYYFQTSTGTYFSADSLFYVYGGNIFNCMTDPFTYNIDELIYYGYGYIDVSDSLYTYDSISGIYSHIDKYFNFTFSPSDSLYMSFYYQPQGLGGNDPQPNDSLVLEFKIPGNSWKHIWSVPGSADKPFKQVLIPISDSMYFVKGFQFRFKNYASIAIYQPGYDGFACNVDIWNIDYVKIAKNRSITDTIYDDVAFVYNVTSFLIDYESVPWNHYKSITEFKDDTLNFFYRNLSDSTKNIKRHYKVTNKTSNSIILNRTLGNENIAPFSDFNFIQTDTSNYFPFTTADNADFEVKISQTSSTLNIHAPYRWNDTLKYHQKFENYYAYDDGIPEYGFDIVGGNPNTVCKVAFKFYTLKPDTLRGVYMFFNRKINYTAHQKKFYITVWNEIAGKPNQIIYRSKIGEEPEYHGLNEFYYYPLDSPVFITNTFFIGYTHVGYDDYLNLGFDLSYDASSKVFYDFQGFWQNYPFAGTPMLRPVFSMLPIEEINEITVTSEITIYPNPASDYINIHSPADFRFQILDITGRIVLETIAENKQINVSQIPSGIYILRGINQQTQFTRKLIINR